MKKYRYGDTGPGLFSRFKKYNLFYFVLAWNVCGYAAYKYAVNHKPENWKKMDSSMLELPYIFHRVNNCTLI